MNLKLKKKVENGHLYYLVSDEDKPDTYYEYYEFRYYKSLPTIENVCYKIMGTELMKAYKNRSFSSTGYKSTLFLLHGIILDNNVIDFSSFKNLSKLVDNIRYKDLYNAINSFRKKLSIEVLDYFKNKLLAIEPTELSIETQDLFDNFISTINYTKDKNALFKEVLFLSIIEEYNRSYVKVYEKEQEINQIQEKYKNYDEDRTPAISLI